MLIKTTLEGKTEDHKRYEVFNHRWARGRHQYKWEDKMRMYSSLTECTDWARDRVLEIILLTLHCGGSIWLTDFSIFFTMQRNWHFHYRNVLNKQYTWLLWVCMTRFLLQFLLFSTEHLSSVPILTTWGVCKLSDWRVKCLVKRTTTNAQMDSPINTSTLRCSKHRFLTKGIRACVHKSGMQHDNLH